MTKEEVAEFYPKLPLDHQLFTDHDWLVARAYAAGVIRHVLWLGRGAPRVPASYGSWSISRELTIWNQLAKQHGPLQVNGAMLLAREAIGFPAGTPLSLLVFNGKGKRHYLMRAIGLWEKRRLESGEPNKAGSVLNEILRGATR